MPEPSPPADLGAGRYRLLVPAAGLCLLVGTAAYLMGFTMLGQISGSLNVSGPMLGWIVIAIIITGTVSAALFPALGSVIGQRRLMVVTMGCLTVGSVLSAAAPDAAMLLAGRIIAAPGFAGEHRSGPSLPRSYGIIAAFAGAAAGVGFTLGGVVEEAARGDWRSVFIVVAAVSAVTGALAAVTLPGGALASRRADVPGALLLAGGLVAALLPITEGAAWGWTSWRVVGLFAAAVVLLTAWAVTELRLADPLVRLGVLAIPGSSPGQYCSSSPRRRSASSISPCRRSSRLPPQPVTGPRRRSWTRAWTCCRSHWRSRRRDLWRAGWPGACPRP